MATQRQKTMIHVLKAKLNLPDEHYRDMLASYGVTSSADEAFSFSDAKDFIQKLTEKCKARGIQLHKPQAEGMITFSQKEKIKAMWREVSRQSSAEGRAKALETFIHNKWGISKLDWVPIEYAGRIIHTLNKMKEQSCKQKNT